MKIPEEKIPLSYWPLVDVPGSPNLSRLFEALKIECSEEIPPLSLDSPISTSVQQYLSDTDMDQGYYEKSNNEMAEMSQSEAAKTSDGAVMIHPKSAQTTSPSKLTIPELNFSEWTLSQWDFSRGQPLNFGINQGPMKALSPFPITEPDQDVTFSDFRHSWQCTKRTNPEMKALWLKNKWLRLRRVWGATDARSLEAQEELAFHYYGMSKYKLAESLFRHIGSCWSNSRGFKCHESLWSYLGVIKLLQLQGKFRQAAKIHRQVHETILNIVSPEDGLYLESNILTATRLLHFDRDEEACTMQRELLQIMLNTRGLRNRNTLFVMQELAISLCELGKAFESEELLDIIMQLQRVIRNNDYAQRMAVMYGMIWTLQAQGRHEEGTKLAMALVEQSTTILGRDHDFTIKCQYLVGVCLFGQSRFEEGEALLRELLDVHENEFLIGAMETLAYYLENTGRNEEAARYYEIVFTDKTENEGVENPSTIYICDRLGRCYERLGRHEEAFSLYQDTVDQLRSEVGEDHPATQKVRGWIVELHNILANQEKIRSDGGEESNISEDSNNGEDSAEDDQLDAMLELNDVANVGGSSPKVVGEDESQEEEWMEALFDFQKLQDDAINRYG